MVSSIGIAVVGIILTVFLSFGGIELTKKAVTSAKTLTKDAFDVIGVKEDPEKSTGTADRAVEDL